MPTSVPVIATEGPIADSGHGPTHVGRDNAPRFIAYTQGEGGRYELDRVDDQGAHYDWQPHIRVAAPAGNATIRTGLLYDLEPSMEGFNNIESVQITGPQEQVVHMLRVLLRAAEAAR